MRRTPFLTVDECLALDKLLGNARYEARQDARAGRSQWAQDAEEEIAIVQGIIDRHRAYTLRQMATPEEETDG
jgi:hypothetical protein